MKFRKMAIALAAILGATTLAACAGDNTKVSFTEYWNKNWAVHELFTETLDYDIAYEKGNGLNVNYALDYTNGRYQTVLKSSNNEYELRSTMTIDVTYTLSESATVTYSDSVTTNVKFKKADNALRPVYSKKTVVSHTPINAAAGKLADCYTSYDYTLETNYQEDNSATSKITYRYTESDLLPEGKAQGDIKQEYPVGYSYYSEDYTYLDNEQLLMALRIVSGETSSGAFEIYNPFVTKMQKINFSFAGATGGEFTHTVNGAALPSPVISYRSVSLTLDDKNPGATQTAWIAAVSDPNDNAHRNVMLRLETPLSYNLGKLVYTLKSAVYA